MFWQRHGRDLIWFVVAAMALLLAGQVLQAPGPAPSTPASPSQPPPGSAAWSANARLIRFVPDDSARGGVRVVEEPVE